MQTSESHSIVGKSPEIKEILSETNLKKQVEAYTRLIERIGPEQAQEELQHSGVQYTGQMHLLNHTVGDVIWRIEGPSGITKCKDYFSSSCYHGFILNAIGDGKLENLTPSMTECRKKGLSNYAQCAHAVGHGLLAHAGYANLMEALELCDDIKGNVPDFYVDYCYNGVFMENIWGLHEGKPSSDRWVSKTDVRYPCNDDRLRKDHLPECWYNQALHMYSAFFSGNSVQVAEVCSTVEEERSRYMCFDGTFRSLHSVTGNNMVKKFEICKKMPKDWIATCIALQAGASFQQGDREFPYAICANTDMGKNECYNEIVESINFQVVSKAEKNLLCTKIPAEYRGSNCGITLQ